MPTYQLKKHSKDYVAINKVSWKNVFLSPGIKTFGTHEFHIVDHFNVTLRVEKVVLEYHYHP